MGSLREIRKRIKSVKNTEKITRAMKMVAAAKLRRAQDEVRHARPYSEKLGELISHLARRVEQSGTDKYPLLAERAKKKRAEVIVLTSDRGLCGAFNSNVVRRAQRFVYDLQNEYKEVRISTIGRKGFEAFKREHFPIRTNYTGVLEHANHARASDIGAEVCKSFVDDELDAVWLVYNEFQSAIVQKAVIKQMLPVQPKEVSEGSMMADYIYEPSQQTLLEDILPRYFATKLYQAFAESIASEHGARMTAMENATRNAKEMIGRLTLQYNRARQAAITKELMEIIGGAEAISAA